MLRPLGIIWAAALVILLAGSPAAQDDLAPRLTITGIALDDGFGVDLRSPTAGFFDTHSRELIVCDGGRGRIVIFDEQLLPKYSFPHFVRTDPLRPKSLGEPRGAVANSNGDFIVADNLSPYLHVLDFRGTPIERIHLGATLGDSALRVKPEALDIDPRDNLYVLVSGDRHTVLMLDREFKLVRTIGTKGADSSQFNTIVSLAEHEGLLLVADLYGTPAIKIYDTAGSFLSGFGGHDVERTDFSMPSGIDLLTDPQTGEQLVFVTDALRQVVKVLTRNGEFVSNIGGFGAKLGEFRYPSSVVANGLGDFFIVEKGGNRIQAFQFR